MLKDFRPFFLLFSPLIFDWRRATSASKTKNTQTSTDLNEFSSCSTTAAVWSAPRRRPGNWVFFFSSSSFSPSSRRIEKRQENLASIDVIDVVVTPNNNSKKKGGNGEDWPSRWNGRNKKTWFSFSFFLIPTKERFNHQLKVDFSNIVTDDMRYMFTHFRNCTKKKTGGSTWRNVNVRNEKRSLRRASLKKKKLQTKRWICLSASDVCYAVEPGNFKRKKKRKRKRKRENWNEKANNFQQSQRPNFGVVSVEKQVGR